jgi:hypothetical protein
MQHFCVYWLCQADVLVFTVQFECDCSPGWQVSVSDNLYHFIHELWLQNAPIGELSWGKLHCVTMKHHCLGKAKLQDALHVKVTYVQINEIS